MRKQLQGILSVTSLDLLDGEAPHHELIMYDIEVNDIEDSIHSKSTVRKGMERGEGAD